MKSIIQRLTIINSGCAFAIILFLFSNGCNRANSDDDTVTDTNTDTDTITDTTEERRLMYQYDADLYYAPFPDGGEDTDGTEGYYVTQEKIVVCFEATCSESSMALADCGYAPFLELTIYFHEDYPLIGTHDLGVHNGPIPGEGFWPRYCVGEGNDYYECYPTGEWIVAESGSATVTKDGDDYVIEYEATMEDGTHFKDSIRPELCGFPVPEE